MYFNRPLGDTQPEGDFFIDHTCRTELSDLKFSRSQLYFRQRNLNVSYILNLTACLLRNIISDKRKKTVLVYIRLDKLGILLLSFFRRPDLQNNDSYCQDQQNYEQKDQDSGP